MDQTDRAFQAADLRTAANAFGELADRYCRFVEGMARLEPAERAAGALCLLSELLAAATKLPAHVAPTEVEAVRVEAPPCDLGGFDCYYEVFDPYVRDDIVIGSLSDDLADVYVDLREGLDLLNNNHVADAVWQWRFGHAHSWGDHAADSIRALHRVITGRARELSREP